MLGFKVEEFDFIVEGPEVRDQPANVSKLYTLYLAYDKETAILCLTYNSTWGTIWMQRDQEYVWRNGMSL